MNSARWWMCLVVLVTIGCGDSVPPTAATGGDSPLMDPVGMSLQDAVAPRNELVATPAGWYHRSCVHEIPSGAREDRDGKVVLESGEVHEKQECLFPGRRTDDGRAFNAAEKNRSVIQPPDNNGWIEFASHTLGGTNAFGEISANWVVPSDPEGSYAGGAGPYYSFPGIQSESPTYILQPVLQWGYNGAFGGSYWTLASWSCSSTESCNHSTPISASEGDVVLGSVAASACDNDECTWTIVSRNVTTQNQTTRVFVDTWEYPWATGGAVEVYDIATCSQYPQDGISYYNIYLEDKYGSPVSPNWYEYTLTNPNPACDFGVDASGSTVDLLHNPPELVVDIDGPTYISSSGTYQWEADVSGGIGNYVYQWYHRTNHSTPTCTYQTDWVSGGTGSSTQFFVSVPGYMQQVRLEVISGDQEDFDNQYVSLSRYLECPQKTSGGSKEGSS